MFPRDFQLNRGEKAEAWEAMNVKEYNTVVPREGGLKGNGKKKVHNGNENSEN